MAAMHVRTHLLFGRDEELERTLRHGGSAPGAWAVGIAGEAGIGKTAFLEAVVARLTASGGATVLCCAGAEAEARLAYAGLGDLFERLPAGALEALPAPQLEALEVALLRRRAVASARQRAIGTAVLGVLRRLVVDGQRLLVVVDDEHWLDSSTAVVLAFALRRLVDEPVGVLTSFRPGGGRRTLAASIRGAVKEVELGPLSLEALVAALDAHGMPHRRRVAARIHELSRGNPLLALELAREGVDLADGALGALGVRSALGRTLGRRLDELDDAARAAVLYAAALHDPSAEALETALGRRRARAAVAAAIAAGVLRREGSRVRFTHPLLASVAYEAADAAARRAAHRRLAAVVTALEERARHLVLASAAPDEAAAALAEQAAESAYARGAPDAAAELLAASLRATPEHLADAVARRTVDRGRLLFEIGDGEGSRRLLHDYVARCPAGPRRARALHVLGLAASFERDKGESARLLEQALEEASGDPATEMLVRTELSWASELPNSACIAHADAALALADRVGDPGLLSRALLGRVFAGGLADEPPDGSLLDAAEAAQRAAAAHPSVLDDAAFFRGIVLVGLDDLDAAAAHFDRLLRIAVERGEDTVVAELHAQLGRIAWFAGCCDDAARHATVAARAAAVSGHGLLVIAARSLLLHVAAARAPDSREAVASCAELAVAAAGSDRSTRATALAGVGFAALARGDPAAALAALAEVDRLHAELERVDGRLRHEGNHIEALIACHHIEDAERVLVRLEARGARLPRPWIAEVAGRCRALVEAAEGDVAAGAHRLASLAATPPPPAAFERGRTLLELGRLERRRKRKLAAREALTAAEQRFAAAGAEGWAAVARAERSRVGGRPAASWAELTATERAIAEAVAAGRSNADAALAAHVSVHTVEANLTRVYRKLGVRGRTELAARLAQEPQLLQRGSIGQT